MPASLRPSIACERWALLLLLIAWQGRASPPMFWTGQSNGAGAPPSNSGRR